MNPVIKNILQITGLILLLIILWYLRTLITYVLFSAVLALIGRPLLEMLDKVKIGRFSINHTVSALLVLTLMILVLAGVASLFIPLIVSETGRMSDITAEQVMHSFAEPLAKIEMWLSKYNVTRYDTSELLKRQLGNLPGVADLSGYVNSVVGALGNFFIAFFSILFITFFFLRERNLFIKIILVLAPANKSQQVIDVANNTKRLLTRYFIGLLIQVTLVTFLLTVGLSIMGVRNAIVLGFFGGLFNLIPYLGPLIGGSFGVIITLLSNLHLDFVSELLPLSYKVLLVFSIVQLIDNFIFQPLIFSNSVKAHPLEIFLVISIAGILAGISGMVVAVPAYTFIKILAKEFLNEFRIVKSLTKNL